MSDLNQRVYYCLAQILEITKVPHDKRNRAQLSEVAQLGRELLADVRSGICEKETALLRAALLEDVSAGILFTELDQLRTMEGYLAPPVGYVDSAVASRDGRKQLARERLEEVLLACSAELAVDGYRTLYEIHKTGDLRTNYHSARGMFYLTEGEQQNLDVSAVEMREALGLDARNTLALYGTALLADMRGDPAAAEGALLKTVALGVHRRDPTIQVAYGKLQDRARTAKSVEDVARILGLTLSESAEFEAVHGEVLRTGLHSPLLDAAARSQLKEDLLLKVHGYASPAKRPEDPFDRRLLAINAASLSAQIELLSMGQDLQLADEAVDSSAIQINRQTSAADVTRSVLAGTLSRLWRSRMQRVLLGKESFPSVSDRMAALVRCQDRVVRWLSEAVQSNVETDSRYCDDLTELLTLIGKMYALVNEEPVDAEALLGLIPSEEFRSALDPVLKVLFLHLKRTGQKWEDLDRVRRLDEVCLAVGVGNKLTTFAIGEMGANAYEYLLRTGDAKEQLHARLHLAKLYLDQHRYELAIEHGQAAVGLDGKHQDALFSLGQTYMRAGKRLLGLESMRDAAERFHHPEANVVLAEDCLRDDQPHLAAQYYITAAAHLLSLARRLDAKELEQVGDWLRRARKANDEVDPFPLVIDKSLPRRDRKLMKKELEAKNAQRESERAGREAKIVSLTEQIGRLRSRTSRM